MREKITKLQNSVTATHRKIVELKQGAIAAQAVHREAQLLHTISPKGGSITATQEAQELIDRVLGQEDRFETATILGEIDQGLDGDNLSDRMAAQGFGPSTKTTPDDILARLAKASK